MKCNYIEFDEKGKTTKKAKVDYMVSWGVYKPEDLVINIDLDDAKIKTNKKSKCVDIGLFQLIDLMRRQKKRMKHWGISVS